MGETRFDYRDGRAQAARWALWLGMWWIAAFACVAYSYANPFAGVLQWVCIIVSLTGLVRRVRAYAEEHEGYGFWRRLWLSWTTSFYASLLTTMAQHLYFRFLDKGRLMSAWTEMMNNEEVRQAMTQLYPNVNIEAQIEAMDNITLGDITVCLITLNILLAAAAALLTALLSRPRKDKTELNQT